MSKRFNEYKLLDLVATESEVLSYWDEKNIFEKSISTRAEDKNFIFYEGPPSANGVPGIHHVMARAIKDIFCRYKTLQGFKVQRKAGWDTHGLPVELGVEKELKITKEDIGKKISVEEYNQACKSAVMKYTDIWNNLTKRIGYWVDMEDPYVTYHSKYIESVWWLLSQIYNKDLLYKGYTIQPYSPSAGTGLSSHELNQPGTYKDVTDTTVIAQFKAISETLPIQFKKYTDSIYFLAWTTTPWTLPSNTALTVGNTIDYVFVKTYNSYTSEPIIVILAKELVNSVFSKKYKASTKEETENFQHKEKTIPYYILDECKGNELVDVKYEQLLPYVQPYQNSENAFRIISGDFVTTSEGTGIVHTAPTFGADDALAAKQASPEIPPMLVLDDHENPIPLVDLQGKFINQVGDLSGKYVKNEYYEDGKAPERSVDVDIAIKLKEENKAFWVEKYKHSYPHCWRTDKPILYYPLDSWFIKITEVKDRLFELNSTINWKPASTGEKRFGNWLINANDWNLSRSRFWGIPLPIWRTEDGLEEKMIGSVETLKMEIQKAIQAGFMKTDPYEAFEVGNMDEKNYDSIDLHKNVVDAIILVSPNGKPMKREEDLIDVWFDSGSMPYAQWHYPFENKELIDNNTSFPADYIAEGVDQTRGWFYTLHAIGTLVFDSIAYKNVISNGLVLDKEGKKMSKRLGNAIDPFKTIDTYGADATRWYMIANANPWDNLKFNLEGVDEARRKFFGTLYNTYAFFALYANIDQFNYQESEIPHEDKPEIDRWILSELNTLIKKTQENYESYEPTKVARGIQEFVTENLSNWYVRLCRRRFWKGDYQQDKIAAYQTLYDCLLTVAKLMSPIAPFFSDRLYKDLTTATQSESYESVHLSLFPTFNENLIDDSLETRMQLAQKIASMVLSLRKKEMIKVRQPLQQIMVPVLSETQKDNLLAIADLVKSEVNVKEIKLIEGSSKMLKKTVKPNFSLLGPKYGKEVGSVIASIKKFTQQDIISLEQNKQIEITVNSSTFIIQLNEVEIVTDDIEGWLVASQEGVTVALDITITETLRKEGIARELVNRVQNIRKEKGFLVTDKIELIVQNDSFLEEAIKSNEQFIKNEILANKLTFTDTLTEGTDVAFDSIITKLGVKKNN